jgi:transposase
VNRLTLERAEQVRIDAASGMSDEALAEREGVSTRTVRDCRLGLRYKKAGGPITKRTAQGIRLPDAIIREMRERATDPSVALKSLAEEYDVDVSYVSLVVRGKRRVKAGGPISEPRHRWFNRGNSHI